MVELTSPGFNIVLYQPEIPANTGNIGRLCVGSNSVLHIVKPCRFLMDDKSLRRAGLDYWSFLKLKMYESFAEVASEFERTQLYFCTTKTDVSYLGMTYKPGDCFIFGPESRGLPESLLAEYKDNCISIPMNKNIRSINLSNSVAIVLYEAIRQNLVSK
jgi:tRNA (cytidine/uridine-2'-O-)-methyltransferase